MNVRSNVPLNEMTTFRVGGNARFFVAVSLIEELKEALLFAKKEAVPFFVLGGGSNVLLSDQGFQGLVIKNEIKGIKVNESSDAVAIEVGAGENWDSFVEMCVEKEFGGPENLSAIPGTVGAAPVQNIGAYGVEVKEFISKVTALDSESLEVKVFSNEECEFSYRNSLFKTGKGKKYIIVNVTFSLPHPYQLRKDYKDIKEYIERNHITELTPRSLRDATIAIRAAKLPPLNEFGTAGSFFKNPIITKEHYEHLKKQFPLLPSFPVPSRDNEVKIPLAWILDNVCNFKGLKVGNVGVYKNQALVLVNFGGASSQEIKALAEMMTVKVKELTDITIEPEVQYVG